MASAVVWIKKFSGASLDLFCSDFACYRCCKKISVGVHPVPLQNLACFSF